MIGDGPVIAAEVIGEIGDFFEAVMAVAPGRMVVQGTAQVGPFDQAWNSSLLRGRELAMVLAQFGRNVAEAELGKD